MSEFSAERMADVFSAYLREHNTTIAPHVFRVITWVGMLTLAIERVKVRWWVPRSRQLRFETAAVGLDPERRFKVRYSHTVRPKGGIEIVEIESGRGEPEIGVVARFSSLGEVELFHGYCFSLGYDFAKILDRYDRVTNLRDHLRRSAEIGQTTN